jgi:hypothetical protein
MVALDPFEGSARKVPLQTMQKKILQSRGVTVEEPVVEPGHVKLYSFYKPGLLAGDYVIEAEQTITSQNPSNSSHQQPAQEQYQVYNRKILYGPDGKPIQIGETPDGTPIQVDRTKPVSTPQDPSHPDYAPQEFTVVAPQFNLDPKLIDSYYPPDGHQDECRILPHLGIYV